MEITNITIRKINSEGKMKAIVSVTFDNDFVVHDIKVIEGTNGFFIAMPSRKTLDGEFKDIVHPINSEFREILSAEVMKKYREALENLVTDRSDQPDEDDQETDRDDQPNEDDQVTDRSDQPDEDDQETDHNDQPEEDDRESKPV